MTQHTPGVSNDAQSVHGATLNILVVDDESDLREMLTRSFSREGHRVMAVADGRAAIDRASTDHFDIVLLDVALGPGPDGYEVCRTLRTRRNVVPIIMLTALDSEADAVLGLEAGADDYVTKPFGLAELRSRIRAVLRRAGTRAMGDEVLVVGPISLDRAQREVTIGGDPVKLTFSEFELLDALMPTAIRARSTCTYVTSGRSSSPSRRSRATSSPSAAPATGSEAADAGGLAAVRGRPTRPDHARTPIRGH
jgi:DNA-binding response OmpR family regulator